LRQGGQCAANRQLIGLRLTRLRHHAAALRQDPPLLRGAERSEGLLRFAGAESG
jgi:hypothetical protein